MDAADSRDCQAPPVERCDRCATCSSVLLTITSSDWPLEQLTVEGPVAELLPLLAARSRLDSLWLKPAHGESARQGETRALTQWLPKLASLQVLQSEYTDESQSEPCVWELAPSLSMMQLRWNHDHPAVSLKSTSLTALDFAVWNDGQIRAVLETNASLRALILPGLRRDAEWDLVLRLSSFDYLDAPSSRAAFALLPRLSRLLLLTTPIPSSGAASDGPALLARLPGLQRSFFVRHDGADDEGTRVPFSRHSRFRSRSTHWSS